mmetsp:Transcript_18802/g.17944  ORF Transcript_18802/g.17944 Transcript_18802/m.17944 type:complete len:92 (-) Transcript_18802:38-313(-)
MIASDNIFCSDCIKEYQNDYSTCMNCRNTQITELDIQMLNGRQLCQACYFIMLAEKEGTTPKPTLEGMQPAKMGRFDEMMTSMSSCRFSDL